MADAEEDVKKRKLEDGSAMAAAHNGATCQQEGAPRSGSKETMKKVMSLLSREQLEALLLEAAWQHSDVMENARAFLGKEPGSRKLFVRGLGFETVSETLKAAFAEHGEIEEGMVISDKDTGRSRGFGFVTYRHIDGCLAALEEPFKTIDGRVVMFQLAAAGPQLGAVQAGDPRKIYVGNVPAECTVEQVEALFSEYGSLEEPPIGFDRASKKSKGYALILYQTVEAAKKALLEPHKMLAGHQVYCKLAGEGSKQRGVGQNQGQGQGQLSAGNVSSPSTDLGKALWTQGQFALPQSPMALSSPAQALNPQPPQQMQTMMRTPAYSSANGNFFASEMPVSSSALAGPASTGASILGAPVGTQILFPSGQVMPQQQPYVAVGTPPQYVVGSAQNVHYVTAHPSIPNAAPQSSAGQQQQRSQLETPPGTPSSSILGTPGTSVTPRPSLSSSQAGAEPTAEAQKQFAQQQQQQEQQQQKYQQMQQTQTQAQGMLLPNPRPPPGPHPSQFGAQTMFVQQHLRPAMGQQAQTLTTYHLQGLTPQPPAISQAAGPTPLAPTSATPQPQMSPMNPPSPAVPLSPLPLPSNIQLSFQQPNFMHQQQQQQQQPQPQMAFSSHAMGQPVQHSVVQQGVVLQPGQYFIAAPYPSQGMPYPLSQGAVQVAGSNVVAGHPPS